MPSPRAPNLGSFVSPTSAPSQQCPAPDSPPLLANAGQLGAGILDHVASYFFPTAQPEPPGPESNSDNDYLFELLSIPSEEQQDDTFNLPTEDKSAQSDGELSLESPLQKKTSHLSNNKVVVQIDESTSTSSDFDDELTSLRLECDSLQSKVSTLSHQLHSIEEVVVHQNTTAESMNEKLLEEKGKVSQAKEDIALLKTRAKLAGIRHSYEICQLESDIRDLEDQHHAQITKIRHRHALEMERMKNHVDAIDQDHEDFEDDIYSLTQDHTAQMKDLRCDYNESIQHLKGQFMEKLAGVHENHQAQVEQFKITQLLATKSMTEDQSRYVQLQCDHKDTCDQLNIEHQKKIQELEQEHRIAIRKLDLELIGTVYELNIEHDQLMFEDIDQIDKIKNHLHTASNNSSAMEMRDSRPEGQISGLQSQIEALKLQNNSLTVTVDQLADELEHNSQLKLKLEQRCDSLQDTVHMSTTKLSKAVDRFARMEATNQSLEDQIETLFLDNSRLKSLKGALSTENKLLLEQKNVVTNQYDALMVTNKQLTFENNRLKKRNKLSQQLHLLLASQTQAIANNNKSIEELKIVQLEKTLDAGIQEKIQSLQHQILSQVQTTLGKDFQSAIEAFKSTIEASVATLCDKAESIETKVGIVTGHMNTIQSAEPQPEFKAPKAMSNILTDESTLKDNNFQLQDRIESLRQQDQNLEELFEFDSLDLGVITSDIEHIIFEIEREHQSQEKQKSEEDLIKKHIAEYTHTQAAKTLQDNEKIRQQDVMEQLLFWEEDCETETLSTSSIVQPSPIRKSQEDDQHMALFEEMDLQFTPSPAKSWSPPRLAGQVEAQTPLFSPTSTDFQFSSPIETSPR